MKIRFLSIIGLTIGLILLNGCDYDAPTNGWDEAQKKEQIVPVITQVLPALAGSASEITLIGEKFSAAPGGNIVYFNNMKATIVSESATRIVVYRPDITGDSLTIKVVVNGAVGIARYQPYKMDNIMGAFGIILDSEAIIAMSMDKDENSYFVLRDSKNNVIKLDAAGKRADWVGEVSNLATDAKIGPSGGLYVARKREQIYLVPAAGGKATTYATLPTGGKVEYIDFDQNGNLFGIGDDTGIYILRSNKTGVSLGFYKGYNAEGLRVYNGYVYVLVYAIGDGTSGIYRNQILSADGQLGPNELVLNWTQSGAYASAKMLSLEFSAAGDMLVGTDHIGSSPVLLVRPDKTLSPLYYGLISAPVDVVQWGNHNYLYLLINRRMPKKDGGSYMRININAAGAPYYGRNL